MLIMNKSISKVDQVRALSEARHLRRTQQQPIPEARKPPRTELQREIDALIEPKVPAPDLKPAKPAKNIATKRKKRTAEVIGKTRQASREGKRPMTVYVDPDLAIRVKVIAAQEETTIEEWVTTAIEMRLGIK
jgi:hypothetical protein